MTTATATTPMPAPPSLDRGVLSDANAEKRQKLIGMLTKAYWMEIETVMSYLAASTNLDGVRAQEIVEALDADVEEELGHARQFAERIKQLWGIVPGSMDFAATQASLQPPGRSTDVEHVVRGVVEAESGAIEYYNEIVEFSDGFDLVTQDLVIDILRDEEGHLRLFEGFLRELAPAAAR